MRVKPRAGYVVRDPARPSTPLPAEGADVPRTPYWMRRLAKGDVELAPEPIESEAQPRAQEE